jgi:hypothetical protein
MLSCCEKNVHTSGLSNYEIINFWIEENMKRYYLWNDRINSEEMDKNENPKKYFRQFLIPEDSYSSIEDNFKLLLLKWSENKKSGYFYFLYSTATDDVFGKITCVVKESPADKAGLKRGLIFTKINGTSLSVNNYRNLISQMRDMHTLTVRGENNSETDYSISATEYSETPIFLDTVYDFKKCKVGYLVYNSFISDNGDFSQEYDMQLNDVFEKFKNENINELILDLRYNDGEHIFNSMIMASLIVDNLDINEVYARYQYNKSLQQIIQDEFGSDYSNLYYTNVIKDKPLNNIGDKLDRVFILTSPKTGVMGEILINGLKLSTNVVVVGNKTVGKNMFSIFLYEKDPEKQRINTWIIAPVVIQISNKAGNTDTSFAPNFEITEPLHDDTPLGDINEKILSKTLKIILDDTPSSTERSDITNIITEQSPVNQLQSLSINRIPRK